MKALYIVESCKCQMCNKEDKGVLFELASGEQVFVCKTCRLDYANSIRAFSPEVMSKDLAAYKPE